jgi:hypothetical protein
VLFRKQIKKDVGFSASRTGVDARTAFLMRCHARAHELEPLIRDELNAAADAGTQNLPGILKEAPAEAASAKLGTVGTVQGVLQNEIDAGPTAGKQEPASDSTEARLCVNGTYPPALADYIGLLIIMVEGCMSKARTLKWALDRHGIPPFAPPEELVYADAKEAYEKEGRSRIAAVSLAKEIADNLVRLGESPKTVLLLISAMEGYRLFTGIKDDWNHWQETKADLQETAIRLRLKDRTVSSPPLSLKPPQSGPNGQVPDASSIARDGNPPSAGEQAGKEDTQDMAPPSVSAPPVEHFRWIEMAADRLCTEAGPLTADRDNILVTKQKYDEDPDSFEEWERDTIADWDVTREQLRALEGPLYEEVAAWLPEIAGELKYVHDAGRFLTTLGPWPWVSVNIDGAIEEWRRIRGQAKLRLRQAQADSNRGRAASLAGGPSGPPPAAPAELSPTGKTDQPGAIRRLYKAAKGVLESLVTAVGEGGKEDPGGPPPGQIGELEKLAVKLTGPLEQLVQEAMTAAKGIGEEEMIGGIVRRVGRALADLPKVINISQGGAASVVPYRRVDPVREDSCVKYANSWTAGRSRLATALSDLHPYTLIGVSVSEGTAKAERVQTAGEKADQVADAQNGEKNTAKPDPEARGSFADVVKWFNVPEKRQGAFRKFLERWRKTTSRGWVEAQTDNPSEPRIFYVYGAIEKACQEFLVSNARPTK